MKGISKDKFTTLHNFVDINKFNNYNKQTCRKKLNLPKNEIELYALVRCRKAEDSEYEIKEPEPEQKECEIERNHISGKVSLRLCDAFRWTCDNCMQENYLYSYPGDGEIVICNHCGIGKEVEQS